MLSRGLSSSFMCGQAAAQVSGGGVHSQTRYAAANLLLSGVGGRKAGLCSACQAALCSHKFLRKMKPVKKFQAALE